MPIADQFWPDLGVRIAMGGGLYLAIVSTGISLAICVFGIALAVYEAELVTVLYAAGGLVFTLILFPLPFALGFICTSLVAILVVASAAGSAWLIGQPIARDRWAMRTGALVGYLATLPLWLTYAIVSFYQMDNLNLRTGVFLCFSIGAIVVGQTSGRVAALRFHRPGRLGAIFRQTVPRFTLRSLLAIMVPVSVLLTLLKATGLLTVEMAIASTVALGVSFATEPLVTWGINVWVKRRQRKRREERLANAHYRRE